MRKWQRKGKRMEGHDVHSSTVSHTVFLFSGQTPQAKQSTKFTLAGHAYTPSKKRKYLNDLTQDFIKSLPKGYVTLSGRLRVSVVYSFPWRKSDSKISKRQSWAYMDKRPDADNLFKPVGDALQLADVIQDDSQIVELRVRKIRTEYPGVAVKIEQISEFI